MPDSPIEISSWPIHQDIGSETRDCESRKIRAWQTLRRFLAQKKNILTQRRLERLGSLVFWP